MWFSISKIYEYYNDSATSELINISFSIGAIKYLNTTDIAGITYFQGSYKLVLFGFGFEAINETGPFVSQDSVLSRILNWFEVESIFKLRETNFWVSESNSGLLKEASKKSGMDASGEEKYWRALFASRS